MNDEITPILIAQSGPLRGQRWGLNDDELVIGRDTDCDVAVRENTVSRRHAIIFREGREWKIEDNSKNGTYVNQERVVGPVVLRDGDVISIAAAVQIAFVGSDVTVPLDLPARSDRRMRVDIDARRVWCVNRELLPALSKPQYRLLVLLYLHPGDVCTREEVIRAVWPDAIGAAVTEQSIDALVRRLRDRLIECDPEHQYVETVRGHGFRLDNPLKN